MQFYDFFKELIGYIPSDYEVIRSMAYTFLPYFLMACALFTSFFALKCGAWWCGLTFFMLGSSVSWKYLIKTPDIYNFQFWILAGVCISIGILCAYFSKYLFRVQLLGSMFMLVYGSLPSFIFFFGDIPSKVISAVAAAALVFLTVKYKYLVVIATTSFSGSFIFWQVLCNLYPIPHETLFAVLMGIVALIFQVMINIDTILDTYDDVTNKIEKTKHGGEKAMHYLKEKSHHIDETQTEKTEEVAADDGDNKDTNLDNK